MIARVLSPRLGARFGRRPMLTAGLAIVGAFVAMALFAPLVAPYDPIFQDAADFDLELIEARTLDGRIQQLIYEPRLHV